MKRYSLSHLADGTLLRDLAALVARDRDTTADLLAHIAEVDARKLYLPAAYPSMFAYCVGELHMSEDAAYKRIQAARAARRFPAMFSAVAEGQIHLSGACLLAPHLTDANVDELLSAGTHQTKAAIERLLATRFPKPDVMALVQPVAPQSAPPPAPGLKLSPGIADGSRPIENGVTTGSFPTQLAPGQVHQTRVRSQVKPLAPQRYAVQFTLSQSGYDKLRYAQELLSHQVAAGDIAAVVERALDALIPQLEKRKFAATDRPSKHPRQSKGARHIPAQVRRAVWQRDRGQCTFVSETGHRCPARTHLEFDHVEPVASGGEATLTRIRLRCRAHNQYAAEQVFGIDFMRSKRHGAREAQIVAS